MDILPDAVLASIRTEFSKLKVPHTHDKCYKDECMMSFDSPFSDGGLYVNMSSLQGYGAEYWRADALKSGAKLYLHEKWIQVPKEKKTPSLLTEGKEVADTPTKLEIGTSDGFQVMESQFDLTKENSLVVLMPSGEEVKILLPNTAIPEFASNVANAIADHDGMKSKMQVDTWSADSEIKDSKYAASLPLLDSSGKKVSSDPKTWSCEMSGDTENLWLNLSTGYIGGGRKNWDGTGGSGAALVHYEETGLQYPLCVKLGTITAHGADIWSYAADEDCLVKVPRLAEYLSHWGIDIQRMEKTDTTMAEMEVKLNMKYDWAKILEAGTELVPLSGPGKIGLRNIGSSCYMNSVLQSVFAIPEIQERYLGNRRAILDTCRVMPADDLAVQMSKLAHAMLTDTYCAPLVDGTATVQMQDGEAPTDSATLEKYIVAPRMFKHIVGKGHPEFSGGRQQDAAEYFQYFLDQLSRSERTTLPRFLEGADAPPTTSSLFEFFTQPKLKCSVTQQVRLPMPSQSNMLELRIPLEAATNRDEVDRYEQEQNSKRAKIESETEKDRVIDTDAPKLHIPFSACLSSMFEDEVIQFSNPSLGGASAPCSSNTRMRSFPSYLMVKLGRYTIGDNWVQVKIDASVPVPEMLDLSVYAREGLTVGEEEMPEAVAAATATGTATGGASAGGGEAVEADEGIVAQLVSMGFPENGCKRAALATGNSDADSAMNWVFAHMEDADFDTPPEVGNSTGAGAGGDNVPAAPGVSRDSVEMLMNYGFTDIQCEAALKSTDGNMERAADWLFSHADVSSITSEAVAAMDAGAPPAVAAASNVPAYGASGQGKYELMSVITHIGRNTDHGHYVCHRKMEDGSWALFNDEKVAQSTKAPLEHGFMYLFRKVA